MRPARSPRRPVVERPRRGQVAAAHGFEQTKIVAKVCKDRTKLQRELLQHARSNGLATNASDGPEDV